MNNPKLVRAVKLALLATSAASLCAPAFGQVAADSETEDVIEEIITTGSRIKTDVADNPRPITIMTRIDIELSGLDNVADVLRNTTFNTYGSFRERSGTSFGQIALVSLRGLGPDYTAVLINGRRVPGNPITGSAAVDLNSIPLSAVERIELLTDSASAIYGADAIGGVINVIFREEFDGAEFEVGLESPSQDGADTEYANFTFGAGSDKTSVIFSGEFFRRDPIFDADRFYSRAEVRDNPAGGRPRIQDTTGVSVGGNTGFETDFSAAFQLGSCDPDIYVPITGPFFGAPATEGCGFAYANRSMMTGGIERKSTFLDARYDIAPDTQVYLENRLTRSETFGRYAPAVGFFVIDANAPTNPFVEVVDDQITGNERDIFAFHRFIGHGNRDETHNITEFDTVLGVAGRFPTTSVNYDAYVRFYDYNNRNEGDTYVIESVLEGLAASGAYDVNDPLSQDPTHLAAIAESSATLLRDISTSYASAAITLDGEAFDMPAGTVGWAAGIEWADETYQDQYDSQREAVNIIGSAGNSAAGARDRWAVFGEMLFPLHDTLEVNLAVRYDDYSDFGTNTSPQVSLRYMPIDRLTLRASYGEGFKAPNLGDLHQEPSQSFNNARDFVQCQAQGIADADCPLFQFENFRGGNPNLDAEESESFNVGVIVEPIENLRFSVDYFEIELSNKVNALSVQEAINLVVDGVALPTGVEIIRGATLPGGVPGVIDFVNLPFANLSSQTIKGFDVRAHYEFETDSAGKFAANLDYSQINEFSEITIPGEPRVEFAGESVGAPKFQAALNLRWQYGPYTVNTISKFIDSHGTATRSWDSYNRHDLTFNWVAPWDGSITVGIRNVADEDPVLESGTTWEDNPGLFLYDVAGRTYFVSYKHTL